MTGRELRELRLQRGMTQQQLAAGICMSTIAICFYERGYRKISRSREILLRLYLEKCNQQQQEKTA